ncbi:hypothetical protein MLD52_04600 [Puniceicoccaceae bacterium K14]|nr:hypothetical protein [Puniceicoccaceae bacterium K14]
MAEIRASSLPYRYYSMAEQDPQDFEFDISDLEVDENSSSASRQDAPAPTQEPQAVEGDIDWSLGDLDVPVESQAPVQPAPQAPIQPPPPREPATQTPPAAQNFPAGTTNYQQPEPTPPVQAPPPQPQVPQDYGAPPVTPANVGAEPRRSVKREGWDDFADNLESLIDEVESFDASTAQDGDALDQIADKIEYQAAQQRAARDREVRNVSNNQPPPPAPPANPFPQQPPPPPQGAQPMPQQSVPTASQAPGQAPVAAPRPQPQAPNQNFAQSPVQPNYQQPAPQPPQSVPQYGQTPPPMGAVPPAQPQPSYPPQQGYQMPPQANVPPQQAYAPPAQPMQPPVQSMQSQPGQTFAQQEDGLSGDDPQSGLNQEELPQEEDEPEVDEALVEELLDSEGIESEQAETEPEIDEGIEESSEVEIADGNTEAISEDLTSELEETEDAFDDNREALLEDVDSLESDSEEVVAEDELAGELENESAEENLLPEEIENITESDSELSEEEVDSSEIAEDSATIQEDSVEEIEAMGSDVDLDDDVPGDSVQGSDPVDSIDEDQEPEFGTEGDLIADREDIDTDDEDESEVSEDVDTESGNTIDPELVGEDLAKEEPAEQDIEAIAEGGVVSESHEESDENETLDEIEAEGAEVISEESDLEASGESEESESIAAEDILEKIEEQEVEPEEESASAEDLSDEDSLAESQENQDPVAELVPEIDDTEPVDEESSIEDEIEPVSIDSEGDLEEVDSSEAEDVAEVENLVETGDEEPLADLEIEDAEPLSESEEIVAEEDAEVEAVDSDLEMSESEEPAAEIESSEETVVEAVEESSSEEFKEEVEDLMDSIEIPDEDDEEVVEMPSADDLLMQAGSILNGDDIDSVEVVDDDSDDADISMEMPPIEDDDDDEEEPAPVSGNVADRAGDLPEPPPAPVAMDEDGEDIGEIEDIEDIEMGQDALDDLIEEVAQDDEEESTAGLMVSEEDEDPFAVEENDSAGNDPFASDSVDDFNIDVEGEAIDTDDLDILVEDESEPTEGSEETDSDEAGEDKPEKENSEGEKSEDGESKPEKVAATSGEKVVELPKTPLWKKLVKSIPMAAAIAIGSLSWLSVTYKQEIIEHYLGYDEDGSLLSDSIQKVADHILADFDHRGLYQMQNVESDLRFVSENEIRINALLAAQLREDLYQYASDSELLSELPVKEEDLAESIETAKSMFPDLLEQAPKKKWDNLYKLATERGEVLKMRVMYRLLRESSESPWALDGVEVSGYDEDLVWPEGQPRVALGEGAYDIDDKKTKEMIKDYAIQASDFVGNVEMMKASAYGVAMEKARDDELKRGELMDALSQGAFFEGMVITGESSEETNEVVMIITETMEGGSLIKGVFKMRDGSEVAKHFTGTIGFEKDEDDVAGKIRVTTVAFDDLDRNVDGSLPSFFMPSSTTRLSLYTDGVRVEGDANSVSLRLARNL